MRVLLGVSQKEFAEWLGCSQATISYWEQNCEKTPVKTYEQAFYNFCKWREVKFVGNQAMFEKEQVEKEQEETITKLGDLITTLNNTLENGFNDLSTGLKGIQDMLLAVASQRR